MTVKGQHHASLAQAVAGAAKQLGAAAGGHAPDQAWCRAAREMALQIAQFAAVLDKEAGAVKQAWTREFPPGYGYGHEAMYRPVRKAAEAVNWHYSPVREASRHWPPGPATLPSAPINRAEHALFGACTALRDALSEPGGRDAAQVTDHLAILSHLSAACRPFAAGLDGIARALGAMPAEVRHEGPDFHEVHLHKIAEAVAGAAQGCRDARVALAPALVMAEDDVDLWRRQAFKRAAKKEFDRLAAEAERRRGGAR